MALYDPLEYPEGFCFNCQTAHLHLGFTCDEVQQAKDVYIEIEFNRKQAEVASARASASVSDHASVSGRASTSARPHSH